MASGTFTSVCKHHHRPELFQLPKLKLCPHQTGAPRSPSPSPGPALLLPVSVSSAPLGMTQVSSITLDLSFCASVLLRRAPTLSTAPRVSSALSRPWAASPQHVRAAPLLPELHFNAAWLSHPRLPSPCLWASRGSQPLRHAAPCALGESLWGGGTGFLRAELLHF